jgi:hypothetical protein
MDIKRIPRPRDPVTLAKLIGDIATGQVVDAVKDGKDPAATELGRKGGRARANALLPEQRQEISRKGASARWKRAGP